MILKKCLKIVKKIISLTCEWLNENKVEKNLQNTGVFETGIL